MKCIPPALLLLLCLINNDLLSQKQEIETDSLSKKENTAFILPILTSVPETGFRFGVIGIYLFRFKNATKRTQPSTIKIPISYTLKNQVQTRLSYEIFFNDNRHYLEGELTWRKFPLLFYGLGSHTKASDEEVFTTRSSIIEINYLAKIKNNIFLGARYDGLISDIIENEEEGLLASDNSIRGRKGATASGLGVIIRFDKRDNIFNPTSGPFLQSRMTFYGEALGGDYNFTKFELDIRHFLEINKSYVLAFQARAEQNWGNPPFEKTALLGNDEIMRGHVEGRFRWQGLWAIQSEFRFPLGRKSWIVDPDSDLGFWNRWGMVAFAGVGNVTRTLSDFSINNMKHSLGIGFRYLAKASEQVNIRIDFGFGTSNPAFYMDVREAF